MDYDQVDQIITSMGFASEPAFDDVTILLAPIPSFNGCPLGLYYPVSEYSPQFHQTIKGKTIIIPPDGTESALKHELGHRHGHYYSNDLSEKYAEDFRKRYEKGRALLYLGNHQERLPRFGALFEEGERGAVEIAMFAPLTLAEVSDIRNQLNSHGETCRVFYGDGEVPFLRVEFTQGIDWMVIIGASLVATVVAGVGAIGYAVYKIAKTSPWVFPVTLAGAGAFLLLLPAIRKARAGR